MQIIETGFETFSIACKQQSSPSFRGSAQGLLEGLAADIAAGLIFGP